MNVNSFLKCIRENQSPTKQEEMDLLHALRSAFEHNHNTYLHSLFHSEMCTWVCKQIELDVSTDIWGTMVHAQTTKASDYDRLREEYEAVCRDSVRTEERLTEALQAYEIAKRSTIEMSEQIANLLEELGETRQQLITAERKLNHIGRLAGDALLKDQHLDPVELKSLFAEE